MTYEKGTTPPRERIGMRYIRKLARLNIKPVRPMSYWEALEWAIERAQR